MKSIRLSSLDMSIDSFWYLFAHNMWNAWIEFEYQVLTMFCTRSIQYVNDVIVPVGKRIRQRMYIVLRPAREITRFTKLALVRAFHGVVKRPIPRPSNEVVDICPDKLAFENAAYFKN